MEKGLNAEQCAEIIAEHFSSISQEYDALTIYSLPPNIRSYLENINYDSIPLLTPQTVSCRIIKARKPMGIVEGDLPKKIIQKCAHIIAVPATSIFNEITRTATYPSSWKVEHQVAIPKVYPPTNEDELRNIAKTPFLSKVYESIVAQWLLSFIKPYLDVNQCGWKGSSITHYLLKFLHFIHETLDMKKPHAVLAICVDLSKAFNQVDHSLVIQDLFDMHTPSWLLKIVFSYLSGRTMKLTFNGATSSVKELPAGSPQGEFLGGLIFMIKFNGAFLRPSIPRPSLTDHSRAVKVKYVDDGSVGVQIDLKSYLVSDPVLRPSPRNFHERTGHILPAQNNPLQ